MRKKNTLCLGLALLLLLQCFTFAAFATPAEPEPTQAPTAEPTQPPTEMPTELDIFSIPFGSADVDYGCHSLDAATALGGDEKLLNSAKGVFVYETRSDTVLYNYNPDERLMPGGLVQILNAMLVLENADLDEVVTVSTYYINQLPLGVRHVELRNGEEITVRDLLYCMMVYSANDAAVVLAEHVAGSPERFITMMNKKAKELGCENTNITTVSGLDDKQQYSTARDMAKILDAAMENGTFREIAGTGTYTVPATNKSDPRELLSTNYQLKDAAVSAFYDERVTAGKATYTSSAAGSTIAFAAENEDLSLICVVIGCRRTYASDGQLARYGNFEDAQKLMEHCFGGFHVRRLLYGGQVLQQLKVENGANDVVAVNRSDVDIVLPTGIGLEDLTLKYDVVGGKLQAPVKKGQEIATLQMWYETACVGETVLYAMTDVVAADDPGYTIQDGASRSDADMAQLLVFLGVALLMVLVPLAVWMLTHSIRKSVAKRRARKMRQQRRDERMQQHRRNRR